jgi:O-antigen/teichoic acid export membrane protein
MIVLMLGSSYFLSVFGADYAREASLSLCILALGALPRVIKEHYVAICRVRGDIQRALFPMMIGCLLELGLAAVGAHSAGLSGLSLGWLCALCIEAAFGFRVVYKALYAPSNIVC